MFHTQPINYVKIKYWNPFKRAYMYVDINETNESSFQIFENRRIPVSYKVYHKKDDNYSVILCKFPRRCEPGFVEAMEELQRNLLIKGHSDYIDFCKALLKKLKDVQQDRQ